MRQEKIVVANKSRLITGTGNAKVRVTPGGRARLVEENSNPESPLPVSADAMPEYEKIARLAYSYWEARGCQGGSAEEDWFRAEQEIKQTGCDA